MCQRYVLPDQTAAEREFLPATTWWQFEAKFNVAPGQYVPAIRLHDRQTEGVMLRWGLIPSWYEGQPSGAPKSSVSSRRVETSKLYRTPWLNSQRCILPASGFYTWRLTSERYRQPFFAAVAQRTSFGIAAIWDRWVGEDDDVIEGCSLLTVPANERVAQITDAGAEMPAILRRKDYAAWLHGTPVAARAVLRPYAAHWMISYPVSPLVNSAAIDDPALIRVAG